MKIKNAITGTIATVAALGVISTFGGESEPLDTETPVTESYAVTETVDIDVPETELAVIETIPVVAETTQIVTEAPKPVTEAPKPATEAPKPVTEAPKPVTEAPKPVTEAPKPATEAPKPEQVLKITSVTTPVEAGAKATLTIKGKPGTEYNIDVIYKKTASKAKGLENKTAPASGTVSWTWKVGSNTTPGTFTIYVSGGGERSEIKFTVTE